ncbi:MAG: hypothetical protein LCH67_06200 [Bacteroidetes bacterium]|nr:hypothetical protein [Bacteroidota bacterium]
MGKQKIKQETNTYSELIKAQGLSLEEMELALLGNCSLMLKPVVEFLDYLSKRYPHREEIKQKQLLVAQAGTGLVDLFDMFE